MTLNLDPDTPVLRQDKTSRLVRVGLWVATFSLIVSVASLIGLIIHLLMQGG